MRAQAVAWKTVKTAPTRNQRRARCREVSRARAETPAPAPWRKAAAETPKENAAIEDTEEVCALKDQLQVAAQMYESLKPYATAPAEAQKVVLAAQIERRRGIAAKIHQRTAVLLVRLGRICADPFEGIDFAFIIDFILGPRLTQNLHNFTRSLVAECTIGFFTGEIG